MELNPQAINPEVLKRFQSPPRRELRHRSPLPMSGSDGIRTRILLIAKQALYQLELQTQVLHQDGRI
jgi:hypothetical protein